MQTHCTPQGRLQGPVGCVSALHPLCNTSWTLKGTCPIQRAFHAKKNHGKSERRTGLWPPTHTLLHDSLVAQHSTAQHSTAHAHKHTHTHTHTHTHACSIPYSAVQTVSVHLKHCYQSCLQVLQCKLQGRPGPDTNTCNAQTDTCSSDWCSGLTANWVQPSHPSPSASTLG